MVQMLFAHGGSVLSVQKASSLKGASAEPSKVVISSPLSRLKAGKPITKRTLLPANTGIFKFWGAAVPCVVEDFATYRSGRPAIEEVSGERGEGGAIAPCGVEVCPR